MLKQRLFFVATAILLCFTGCEEETFSPVLSADGPPALSTPSPGTSYLLTEDSADAQFAEFTWSAADFGFPTEVAYTVEVDIVGNNFELPSNLVPATAMTVGTVSNSKVNNFLIGRGVPAGSATDIEVRVKALIGLSADNNVLFSDPITLSATPFVSEIEYEKLYVPGSYQGWDPSNESTVVYSVEGNGRYEGYLFFPEANAIFKFTLENNWDNGDFGDNDTDGTLDAGGADIPVGPPGLYRINADVNALTYSTTLTNWGLIGSATPTGWDSDTDLSFDEATGVLSITIDLVAGVFKFRANDAWDINFGDTGADQTVDYNGDDIAVMEDGNYTINLLLNQPIYEYRITRN